MWVDEIAGEGRGSSCCDGSDELRNLGFVANSL